MSEYEIGKDIQQIQLDIQNLHNRLTNIEEMFNNLTIDNKEEHEESE